jgi:hypothetical protein
MGGIESLGRMFRVLPGETQVKFSVVISMYNRSDLAPWRLSSLKFALAKYGPEHEAQPLLGTDHRDIEGA